MSDGQKGQFRLVRFCLFIKIFITIGIVLIPVHFVLLMLTDTSGYTRIDIEHLEFSYREEIVFFDFMLSVFPVMFLLNLYSLFTHYQNNRFFTFHQVRLFRSMGLWLSLTSIARFSSIQLESYLLSKGEGSYGFMLVFGTDQAIIACAALICYAMSLVMNAGLELKKECELII